MRAAGTIVFVVGICHIAGCGSDRDPYGRTALTGEVTYAGSLLYQGSIRFVPEDGNGQSAGALIRKGKYEIPREQGLPIGKYRVEISSLEPTPTPSGAPGSDPAPPAKERIAAEYNARSNLKIEITVEKSNRFDFQVK